MLRGHRFVLCVVLGLALWAAPASAAITITPSAPIDFGGVLLNQTANIPVTIESTSGNVMVDFEIINCTGAAGTISVSAASGNLNPDEPLTLSFTPTARGLRSCTLQVREKNNTTQLAAFTVRGTGQTPASISVAVGMTSPPPDPLSFGSARYRDNTVAAFTQQQTITVTNGGDRQLDVTNVTITGDYTFTGGTSQQILGGGSRNWTVTFNPTAAGQRDGAITFTSSAGNRVVNLRGTGTTATINVTPPATDLGIVAIGSSRGADITIANAATTNRGLLGVTSATLSNNSEGWFTICGNNTGTCNFAPAFQIDAMPRLVSVRCTPPSDANGVPRTATITFVHDADLVNAATATVTCTAGSSKIAAQMPALAFAGHLVGTTGTMTMMITNMGNQGANLTYGRSGALRDQFAASGPASLGPGMSGMVTVMFAPTFEGPISANLDVGVQNAVTMGIEAGPSISLDGRGTEKHINVKDALAFPDTFRNPGSLAVPQMLRIENTGEHPLRISALEFGPTVNTDVWKVGDVMLPIDVPGAQNVINYVDVPILFLPTDVGKAPDAPLTIANDSAEVDNTRSKVVILSGNGRARNVDLTPLNLDVGDTFAGVPIRLSISRGEKLFVQNHDDAKFSIRELIAEGEFAGLFEVVDVSGSAVESMELDVGATLEYDIIFTPKYPGDFEAKLNIYLDEDPLPQNPVTIHGRALFANAHGSGGCSTGSGVGSGGAAGLLGLALLLRRRRR